MKFETQKKVERYAGKGIRRGLWQCGYPLAVKSLIAVFIGVFKVFEEFLNLPLTPLDNGRFDVENRCLPPSTLKRLWKQKVENFAWLA